MHTVVETPEFLIAANAAGMSEEERLAAIDYIARNPDAGSIIPGSGGARKIRVAKQGRGKSAGYRVITYYTGPHIPVFLLTVISKGQQGNLTKAQRNELRKAKGQ